MGMRRGIGVRELQEEELNRLVHLISDQEPGTEEPLVLQ
jgi:hypothetical protein